MPTQEEIEISIHTLLAESDTVTARIIDPTFDFYPHSPCGERPSIFLCTSINVYNFYPHSPCGERHHITDLGSTLIPFLSTLSLRRATNVRITHNPGPCYFYPHSPCGERPIIFCKLLDRLVISIHTLLAESDSQWRTLASGMYDFYPHSPCGERQRRWEILR